MDFNGAKSRSRRRSQMCTHRIAYAAANQNKSPSSNKQEPSSREKVKHSPSWNFSIGSSNSSSSSSSGSSSFSSLSSPLLSLVASYCRKNPLAFVQPDHLESLLTSSGVHQWQRSRPDHSPLYHEYFQNPSHSQKPHRQKLPKCVSRECRTYLSLGGCLRFRRAPWRSGGY